ncbi:MAG: tetratricopeptide repeat protein [Acidobacteriaceae bacterium]|jgi:tetratricopeptide (TPR) repeat protein
MQRCFAIATQLTVVALFAAPAGTLVCAENPQLASSSPTLSIPQLPPSGQPAASVDLTPEIRGDLAMAHQQYLQAIDDYSQVPTKTATLWNKLGMAYHHLFAMEEARRDYQRALQLRPQYPEALNNLGAVYYASKSYNKAIRYYRKALQLDPKSAPIYSNLGTAWFARGKVVRGIEAYRTAFALDPKVFESSSALLVNESLPAHDRAQQDYCLAKLFAASGKNEEAIEYLRKALDEGFTDRKKILEDQTLASVRATPEFAQLMTEQKVH